MNRIRKVVSLGSYPPEYTKRSAPIPLPLENDGLLLGGEIADEGIDGFVIEVLDGFGFEGSKGGVEGAGDGCFLGLETGKGVRGLKPMKNPGGFDRRGRERREEEINR